MPLPLFQENKRKKNPNLIAVAAGKGGVGKSTVTVNLARALSHLGYSVGVFDADIYGPSIRKMMPEDRLPMQRGYSLIPAVSRGIKTISMAHFRKEEEASIVRAPIANGIIGQFIRDMEWGPLDFLFFDFPPGTGDIQLTLCQQASLSGAIMITTPQEVAVMDVKKAMQMFEKVNIPIIGVIENMSYYDQEGKRVYPFGKEGGKRLAEHTKTTFLGQIPVDSVISNSGDAGISLYDHEGTANKEIVSIFEEIATQLVIATQTSRREAEKYVQEFELIWRTM